MKFRHAIVALGLASATGLAASTSAVAQEQCVRVVTFDWQATLSIDPVSLVGNSDLLHAMATYEPLVVFDNDFQVSPWLASSWSVSEDGLEWTFELREGVTFHDGKELTAEDVVYTYQRLIDPATTSPGAAELDFLEQDSITAKSPREVSFRTSEPISELPLLLATKYALIVPKGAERDQLMRESNGTGPFVIRDFQPDAPRTTLQRNENYWQQGRPLASCIELSGIPDAVTRATAIKSGAADILVAADATTLPLLQQEPGIELLEATGALLMTMVMMVDQEPFDDVRVRRALKLVVDRETMVQVVTLGFGVAGNDNPVPPTSPFAISADPIPQDIEKARALLAEAGYADGLTVDLHTGASDLTPGMLVMVQAYKEMAAQAGVTVNVVTAPAASFWDDVYLKQPFVTSYWYTRHPVSSFRLMFRSDAKYNETNWHRPEFDKLLDRATVEVDPEARADLYREAQRIITEEGGSIIPVFASLVAAVRQGCTGFVPHVESRIMFHDITCQ
jgi:peptide/nickel transport system substrate-binding protein